MKKMLMAAILLMATAPLAAAPSLIRLTPEQERALGVQTVRLGEGGAGGAGLRLAGEAVAPNALTEVVSAPAAGVVQALKAERLQRVARGQTLALIASPDGIEAQREYLRAQGEARLAEARLRRDEDLFKEGLIAQARLEETRVVRAQADAVLAERRALLRLQGLSPERLADAAQISAQLAVAAPAAGVVEHQFVTPGQRVVVGEPLFRIVRRGTLWLDLHAAAAQLPALRPGQRVSVAGCERDGRIVSIATVADPASQTFLVRAELPAGDACLSPNQFVEAHVADAAAGLPEAALVQAGGSRVVFLRRAGGFEARAATEVTEGEVAVKGTAALKALLQGAGAAP